MASFPAPVKAVCRLIGRVVAAVGPFVFGAVSIVPACAAALLVLNTVTDTYGPLAALRASAIAAEAVVIIPSFVWLGSRLCARIDATRTTSPRGRK